MRGLAPHTRAMALALVCLLVCAPCAWGESIDVSSWQWSTTEEAVVAPARLADVELRLDLASAFGGTAAAGSLGYLTLDMSDLWGSALTFLSDWSYGPGDTATGSTLVFAAPASAGGETPFGGAGGEAAYGSAAVDGCGIPVDCCNPCCNLAPLLLLPLLVLVPTFEGSSTRPPIRPQVVPEPPSVLLLLAFLPLAVVLLRRRRFARS